jgi:hypothetical protein
MDTKTNNITIRIGYWSSFICLALWLVFTLCFIGIFSVNPVFHWTNISDYIFYSQTYNQTFKYIAQLSMLLFGPAFLVLLSSINEYTEKKLFSKIGLNFGIAFVILSSLHYFIQLTTVPQNILKNNPVGLEHLIQSNPISFILALNMLGWTFFLGLSLLFTSAVFSGSRLENIIRYALITNGFFCLLGGVGFVFQNMAIIFLCINFGIGGAMFVVLISLMILFKRLLPK